MNRSRRSVVLAVPVVLLATATSVHAIPPGGPRPSNNGAKVALKNKSVKPGGKLRVSGSGWPASKNATVKLNDQAIIAVFKINRRGRFSGAITVPRNVLRSVKPGRHSLRFLAPASRVNKKGNSSVKKTFRLRK